MFSDRPKYRKYDYYKNQTYTELDSLSYFKKKKLMLVFSINYCFKC